MARLVALVCMLVLSLLAAPAQAASAVAYSAADNTYGWCAGYAAGRSASCALNECANSGGKQCRQVLACPDGWGAMAFAEDPAGGFAAVCGVGNANTARSHAIAACLAATNALCWTDTTFDPHGNVESKDSNYNFDLVWYAQSLLQLIGYTKSSSDGVLGTATLAALTKFQTALGRTPTSSVDEETLRRLIDADQGIHRFAVALKRDIVDPWQTRLQDKLYVDALTRLPDTSFTEELLKRSDDDRRLALATVLASGGNDCTVPADSATVLGDASSSAWIVECVQADYTLLMSDDGGTVVISEPKSSKGSSPPSSSTPAPSPGSAGTNTTPPAADNSGPATDTAPPGAASSPGGRDLKPPRR